MVTRLPRTSRIAIIDRSAQVASFSLDVGSAVTRIEQLQPLQVSQPIDARLEVAARLVRSSDLTQRRVLLITDLAAGPRASFVVNATALALAQGGPESVESLFRSWPGQRLPLVLIVDEQGRDIFDRPVPGVALERAREQLRGANMLSGVRRVLGHNGHEYVIFIPRPGPEGLPQTPSRQMSLGFQLVAALIASLLFTLYIATYCQERLTRFSTSASLSSMAGLAGVVVAPVVGCSLSQASRGRHNAMTVRKDVIMMCFSIFISRFCPLLLDDPANIK